MLVTELLEGTSTERLWMIAKNMGKNKKSEATVLMNLSIFQLSGIIDCRLAFATEEFMLLISANCDDVQNALK